MAARVEDGVETFLLDAVKANSFVKLSFRIDILFESDRKVGPEFRLVTLGVERGMTAFWGCERNLSPSILKNVVGSSEFFESEDVLVLADIELEDAWCGVEARPDEKSRTGRGPRI